MSELTAATEALRTATAQLETTVGRMVAREVSLYERDRRAHALLEEWQRTAVDIQAVQSTQPDQNVVRDAITREVVLLNELLAAGWVSGHELDQRYEALMRLWRSAGRTWYSEYEEVE